VIYEDRILVAFFAVVTVPEDIPGGKAEDAVKDIKKDAVNGRNGYRKAIK